MRVSRRQAGSLVVGSVVTLLSCGPVDVPSTDAGMTAIDSGRPALDASVIDGGTDLDAGATLDAGNAVDSGSTADAGRDAGASTFHITFDYRFDTKGMFADPTHRAALAAAARQWEGMILDEFADVPAGTPLRIRHPEQPYDAGFSFTYGDAIDDVVIFVGSAPLVSGVAATSSPSASLSNITDPTLQASLNDRFNGSHFQPWVGWISFSDSGRFFFDPTPETNDDIPLDKTDFISTATHEIGHVLGFGTAAAFKNHIVSTQFTGTRAVAVAGAPVPMSTDGSHVAGTYLFHGQNVLMDNAASVSGVRRYPTALDTAMLEDIGYRFGP